MKIRRAIVATAAVAALFAHAPAGAVETHSMDGKKTRSMRYTGTLTSWTVPLTSTTAGEPLAPARDQCNDTSCDIRVLKLKLPTGTSFGRFRVLVEAPAQLKAALHLYDSKGVLVGGVDAMRGDGEQNCCTETTYALEIKHPKMHKGTYTLVLFNRVGGGTFEAVVDWYAHPRDRVS